MQPPVQCFSGQSLHTKAWEQTLLLLSECCSYYVGLSTCSDEQIREQVLQNPFRSLDVAAKETTTALARTKNIKSIVDQAIRRVCRLGQRKPILIYDYEVEKIFDITLVVGNKLKAIPGRVAVMKDAYGSKMNPNVLVNADSVLNGYKARVWVGHQTMSDTTWDRNGFNIADVPHKEQATPVQCTVCRAWELRRRGSRRGRTKPQNRRRQARSAPWHTRHTLHGFVLLWGLESTTERDDIQVSQCHRPHFR